MVNIEDVKVFEAPLFDYYDQIISLLDKHVLELAVYKDIMVLNPDFEQYRQLEAAGKLSCIFVEYDDKIIGYSFNFVMNSLHYKHLKFFMNDILFIDPEYRNKEIGALLISTTETIAAKYKADLVLIHAKPETPLLRLLGKLNYKEHDIIHSKVL